MSARPRSGRASESPIAASGPVEAVFQRRAERARLLAGEAVAAGEPLSFAAGLYQVQGRLATAIAALHDTRRALTGRLTDDLSALIEVSSELLGFAAENGPPGLAGVAGERSREAASVLGSRLVVFWGADRATEPDYLSRALLRPYVEVLARLGVAPNRTLRTGHCPFCGAPPWIAARRSAADSDGASRFLGCGLCGGEWLFARIRCPSCSEQNPERLPFFRSDRYPAARIEACETCRRYVKSIDLTVEGMAIPEVDDLVSIGMDLWAAAQGFARIEPGLAGF